MFSFGVFSLKAVVKLSIRTGQDERYGGKMLHNLIPLFFVCFCPFSRAYQQAGADNLSVHAVSAGNHILITYLIVKVSLIENGNSQAQQTVCLPMPMTI